MKIFAFLLISAISLPNGAFSQTSELLDIRPKEVIDGVLPEEVKRGRELIQACFQNHGWQKAINDIFTIRATYTDDWSVGDAFFHQFNNWPSLTQKIKQDFVAFDLKDTRVELLNGVRQGEIWGLDSDQPYTWSNGETKEAEDTNMYPALASKEYIIQLPYWITKVPIIAYVKDTTFNSIEYSLVYGTWRSHEANSEYDQYIYWINKKTHLLEIVNYTVRAVAPTAFGYTTFEDFRLVQGVKIPFIHRMGYDPTKEGDIHILTFDSIEFNPKNINKQFFRMLSR